VRTRRAFAPHGDGVLEREVLRRQLVVLAERILRLRRVEASVLVVTFYDVRRQRRLSRAHFRARGIHARLVQPRRLPDSVMTVDLIQARRRRRRSTTLRGKQGFVAQFRRVRRRHALRRARVRRRRLSRRKSRRQRQRQEEEEEEREEGRHRRRRESHQSQLGSEEKKKFPLFGFFWTREEFRV